MATWGTKRRSIFISIALFILGVSIGIPIYNKLFNTKPTCFDGKQNQSERGVDCGGACAKLCFDESKDPLVLFERLSEVASGIYSALAIVENNNQGAYAKNASYIFRTYDKNDVLLDERFGKTFIPPNKQFPIFEHSIFTGERIPSRTSFSFLYPINWQRGEIKEPSFEILNVVATSSVDNLPRVFADLQNNEVYEIKNIQAVIIIYGQDNNIIGISQTLIDHLEGKGKTQINFTWNKPFKGNIGKIDIIPRAIPREFLR